MKIDLHTHYYPPRYFETIRETPSEFSFGADPTGRTIIRYRGARFFGVTPAMTDPDLRLKEMDRVGIDVEAMERISSSAAVRGEEQRIHSWGIEKLIVRVDRTDPSKNVPRGFLAYERLLRQHPELAGRVQFWAFLQPSRQDVAIYRDYLRTIMTTAERINARLGTRDWLPIRLELGENIHRAVAAYRNYDVLLVNSIYDGMNLVAKEGALLNRRNGVLVLSENAGSWYELGEHAIVINPFDVEAGEQALYRALSLPDEVRSRQSEQLRSAVTTYETSGWIQRQLEDINELAPPSMQVLEQSNGP